MPQYRESLNLRTMQTVIDILRDYPEVFEGRRSWPERVYYRHPGTSEAVTLASIWPNGNSPAIFKCVSRAVKVAAWRSVQAGFRLAWEDRASVWGPSSSLEAETEIAI